MSRTPEEAEAEIEHLLDLNGRLARQLIGMSDTLQESARQIAADAWDKGHESGFWNGRESHGDVSGILIGVEHAKANNPHRKPVETFGAEA